MSGTAVLFALVILTVAPAAGAGRDPTGGDSIDWPRGTADVVVRYDTAGNRAARTGTAVPDRTIYGDGLVVWSEPNEEPKPGFATSVWTGRLEPATIRAFLLSAVDGGFFELAASHRPPAPAAPPGGDPIPLPLDLPAETLAISLVDRRHRVSVRPAGWRRAPESFRQLRAALLALAPEESRRFVAERYRLRAIPRPEENAGDYPTLPPSLADVDLAAGTTILERAQGEALAPLLADAGVTVAVADRVFHLQLLAVPPRAP